MKEKQKYGRIVSIRNKIRNARKENKAQTSEWDGNEKELIKLKQDINKPDFGRN